MSDMSQIAIIKDLIDSAHSNLQDAKNLLNELVGTTSKVSKDSYSDQAKSIVSKVSDSQDQIIEGVFDGQSMIDSDGSVYPVPANYASKSKLVSGDVLKLTIQRDGRFVYKQIGPTDRKYLVGPLSSEEGQFQILSNGKAYKVLLASVTYYKAEIGDQITVLVPLNHDSEWAVIDAVLPK